MSSRAQEMHAPAVSMAFDDNRLLPMLFGEHDRNLAQIEDRLGVSVLNRGNELVISGPTDAADMARDALSCLYQRLKSGHGVEPADVDAAVRMVLTGNPIESFQAAYIQIRRKRISARSVMQARYIEAMRNHDLVFGIGPAGTGKTYLAVCLAVERLLSGAVDRIVLSRPAVEAGESLGFLPGDMREKVDPYLRPLYDALYDMMPGDQVARRLNSGAIEVAPLAFMRGRTLANAFVILDEAQNTTPVQMKMFLTRLGDNSQMVVTGDLSQVDLPPGTLSGLRDARQTLNDMDGITFVHFSELDVERHGLVSRIVNAYQSQTERGGKNSPNEDE